MLHIKHLIGLNLYSHMLHEMNPMTRPNSNTSHIHRVHHNLIHSFWYMDTCDVILGGFVNTPFFGNLNL